ncbi:YdcF family protein [Spirosoma aerophilum]
MFYFFSKTITYLLTPAGWLVSALVLALFVKKTQYRRQLIGLALGIFWLFGNSFLMNELAIWWEYPIQPNGAASGDSVNRVAVVLTGGIINGQKAVPASAPNAYGANRYLLGREADRVGQALYLYKTGVVQKILISGGMGDLPFQTRDVNDEGQMAAQFLQVAGVRSEDIILEARSRNTHENAYYTAPLLRKRFNTNHCVLVTSAWHMRRAIACFQKEGVQVTPFPSNFLGGRRSMQPGDWLLPHEQAFFDSYYLVREFVGYITYKIAGYA